VQCRLRHSAHSRLRLERREADVEAPDLDRETALHQATRFGHEARDQNRGTALYRMTRLEYEAAVQLRLEKGGGHRENEILMDIQKMGGDADALRSKYGLENRGERMGFLRRRALRGDGKWYTILSPSATAPLASPSPLFRLRGESRCGGWG
jgi:hypothetical protein